MVIDIIDSDAPEYQNLTELQLAMIRAAQTEKNAILADAAEEKEKVFLKLLKNNMARSSVLKDRSAAIDDDADRKVEIVREDLLHRLAYESLYGDENENGKYRYPENPNYNLDYPQRFLVVRDYYMHVTTNPRARLEAYGMDSLARTYLGEYYQTLYDLLASYCE